MRQTIQQACFCIHTAAASFAGPQRRFQLQTAGDTVAFPLAGWAANHAVKASLCPSPRTYQKPFRGKGLTSVATQCCIYIYNELFTVGV